MYPAERVRRPVPEIKAVAKAVEMIRVRVTSCAASVAAETTADAGGLCLCKHCIWVVVQPGTVLARY